MAVDKEQLKSLYYDMVVTRKFEEAVEKYSKNGTVPGFVHLSIGQEATHAGIAYVIRETDYKFPDHRSHGAICLFGTDRKKVMAEIFGRATGINGGRGGSMHINDLEFRNMGMNGVEGSTVVTCLGTAFNAVYRKTDDITVVFMGDGTLGEGACHESMNMAATWNLPIVYCLVNNQYAISTHFRDSHPQEQLATWAKGYEVPSEVVDGNDVEAVIAAMEKSVKRCRKGKGPVLIEFMTYRWQGHFSGDPASYRPEDEVKEWKAKCPIKRARKKLVEEHGYSEKGLTALEEQADEEIAEAVKFAVGSPWPDPKNAIKHVYASFEVEDWK